MAIMKRQVEIKLEIHQSLKLRLRAGVMLGWCPQCGEQTEMVRLKLPPEAARLQADNPRFETDKLHAIESEAGVLLVCLQSWSAATAELPVADEDSD